MIEFLAVFAFICMMYFMYGLGVVHGQKHEEKRQRLRKEEFTRLMADKKPNTKAYAMYKKDGYEIFHANLN